MKYQKVRNVKREHKIEIPESNKRKKGSTKLKYQKVRNVKREHKIEIPESKKRKKGAEN